MKVWCLCVVVRVGVFVCVCVSVLPFFQNDRPLMKYFKVVPDVLQQKQSTLEISTSQSCKSECNQHVDANPVPNIKSTQIPYTANRMKKKMQLSVYLPILALLRGLGPFAEGPGGPPKP